MTELKNMKECEQLLYFKSDSRLAVEGYHNTDQSFPLAVFLIHISTFLSLPQRHYSYIHTVFLQEPGFSLLS